MIINDSFLLIYLIYVVNQVQEWLFELGRLICLPLFGRDSQLAFIQKVVIMKFGKELYLLFINALVYLTKFFSLISLAIEDKNKQQLLQVWKIIDYQKHVN